MLCAACDTKNEDSSRFCRMCGNTLGENKSLDRMGVVATPMTGQTVKIAPDQVNQVIQPTCPTCQRPNPLGAKFCVFCAGPMSGGPVPVGARARRAPQIMPQVQAVGGATYVGAPTYIVNQSFVTAGPMVMPNSSVPLLVRAVWFFLLGWWLGLIWTLAAWAFNLTILLLPVGLWMLNRIPQVMTLRLPYQSRLQMRSGVAVIQRSSQIPWILRAIWFVVIGSWASLLWMLTAWGLSTTILLMPIAFWMFDRVPTITTLAAE